MRFLPCFKNRDAERARLLRGGELIAVNGNGTDYGTATTAAQVVDDKSQASQKSKIKSCLSRAKRIIPFIFKTTYTVSVSALFASFAYRHAHDNVALGVFYSLSSFVMNAPTSWFFLDRAIGVGKRIKEKKERAFIIAFAFAFIFAVGTTGAGLKVAKDSVSELEWMPSLLVKILAGFSVINTFSTRFVGSTYLLYNGHRFLMNGLNRCRLHTKVYYQLLKDIELYGDRLGIKVDISGGISKEAALKSYVTQLYTEMKKENLSPGGTCWDTAKSLALSAATVMIIVACMINMQPLWLALTTRGIAKVDVNWSKSIWLVWYAATSNELFYLQSAFKFVPSFVSILEITVPKILAAMANTDHPAGKAMIAAASFSAFAAWVAFAYASGAGYGQEAADALRKGFGRVADKTWMPYMGWLMSWVAYPIVASIASGSVVNGGAFLRFLMEKRELPAYFSFLKFFYSTAKSGGENQFNTYDAKALLQAAKDSNDFSTLQSQGARAHIQGQRNGAKENHSAASCNVVTTCLGGIGSLWRTAGSVVSRCCNSSSSPSSTAPAALEF